MSRGIVANSLRKPHVLVVHQNEGLIPVCVALLKSGCTIVGPVATDEAALILLDETRIDVALLSLSNVASINVAHALERRFLPFAFVTIKPHPVQSLFPRTPVLVAPFDRRNVDGIITRLLTEKLRLIVRPQ